VNDLLKRVVAAMGAGAFGQLVVIVIQVFSLPLFLHKWDTATYGTWLLLSAMPAYFSMTDVGMVATAGNRMTMAMGKGDTAEANKLFHSAVVFVAGMCALALLVTVPVLVLLPLEGSNVSDQRAAVGAMIVGVLVGQFSGLCDAVYNATGRFALSVLLGNLIRLGEWAGYMAGLFIFGTFFGVALSGLIVRLVGTMILALLSARDAKGITWHWRHASVNELKSMAKPAASFMVMPLSNALSIQGITLLVGQAFGPATVALFNSYRTIARVAVQFTGVFSHALWNEFSFLFGRGGAPAVAPVYRRAFTIGLGISLLLSMALYFMSPFLLRIWSHNRIPFESTPMLLLLAYAAVGGCWHVPRVLMLSTNQHVGLVQWTLLSALAAIGLTYALKGSMGISGVCMAMLLSEALIAAICMYMARTLISEPARPHVPMPIGQQAENS
jgi:O-antigen/teichoic acid export membrane protein